MVPLLCNRPAQILGSARGNKEQSTESCLLEDENLLQGLVSYSSFIASEVLHGDRATLEALCVTSCQARYGGRRSAQEAPTH